MKVFSELKVALRKIKTSYLSIPISERTTFLNDYKSNPLFLSIIETMKSLDYTVAGAKDSNDSKFFASGEVDYSNLLDDKDHIFNAGVFFIPKGLYLPPHDHPNMLVISKVLAGAIQMVSMDGIDSKNEGEEIEVEIRQNKIFKQGEIDILTPKDKNFHYIVAKENTIFLDVFVPHYDDVERVCHHYEFQEKDDKLFLKKNMYI